MEVETPVILFFFNRETPAILHVENRPEIQLQIQYVTAVCKCVAYGADLRACGIDLLLPR